MKKTPNQVQGDLSANHAIVLVCDFAVGLCSRIIDVYKFFCLPPKIILVRRGGFVPRGSKTIVSIKNIPLPTTALLAPRLSIFSRVWTLFSVLAYLMSAPIIFLKIGREKRNVTLVHAHFILPQGLFGLLLSRFLHKPLVITVAGSDAKWMMRSSLLRLISIFVLRRARITITVNKPLCEHLLRMGVSNACYVPNSVDVDSILSVSKLSDENGVLFVGTMDYNKRPIFLLRSFEKILAQVSSARLLLCGEGPLRVTVEREIQQRKLGKSVSLIPSLDAATLNLLRSQRKIFVLPSTYEGMSLALLEALAAGQLVVASRNESHNSFLDHGKTALLFEECSMHQLSKMLMIALTEKKLGQRISRAGKKRVRLLFSNKVVAPRLEELYRQISNTLH